MRLGQHIQSASTLWFRGGQTIRSSLSLVSPRPSHRLCISLHHSKFLSRSSYVVSSSLVAASLPTCCCSCPWAGFSQLLASSCLLLLWSFFLADGICWIFCTWAQKSYRCNPIYTSYIQTGMQTVGHSPMTYMPTRSSVSISQSRTLGFVWVIWFIRFMWSISDWIWIIWCIWLFDLFLDLCHMYHQRHQNGSKRKQKDLKIIWNAMKKWKCWRNYIWKFVVVSLVFDLCWMSNVSHYGLPSVLNSISPTLCLKQARRYGKRLKSHKR